MGLSEREQQLLDDMERRFYQSEADFVQAAPSNTRLNLRSLVLGILVLIVGVGLLLAGVGFQQLWMGLAGFAVMVVGALLAFSKREGMSEAGSNAAAQGGAKQSQSRESFSDRMNRRWEQRMDGDH